MYKRWGNGVKENRKLILQVWLWRAGDRAVAGRGYWIKGVIFIVILNLKKESEHWILMGKREKEVKDTRNGLITGRVSRSPMKLGG